MRTAELNELIERACDRFDVDPQLVVNPCRGKRQVADLRHVLIYTIKTNCHYYSLKSIAHIFCKTNHSTVINSIRRSLDYMVTDPIYRDKVHQVQIIADEIKNKFGGN